MKYVVSVGGGLSSTLFLPLHTELVDKFGDDVEYVISVLTNEHPDVWRLIYEVEQLLGIKIKRIGHNKSVWDVFDEEGFIGNDRMDNCSRVLKREVVRDYMKAKYAPGEATVVVGIGHHEIDRTLSIKRNWQSMGYDVYFALAEYENLTKEFMMEACQSLFGFVPELYLLDFEHNNCDGGCVKAGKYQWRLLLEKRPDTFAWWEMREAQWQKNTGSDHTVLREMIKGVNYPVTLKEFRERVQSKLSFKVQRKLQQRARELKIPLADLIAIELDHTPACTFCDAAAGE